jgi:hypothetical protein
MNTRPRTTGPAVALAIAAAGTLITATPAAAGTATTPWDTTDHHAATVTAPDGGAAPRAAAAGAALAAAGTPARALPRPAARQRATTPRPRPRIAGHHGGRRTWTPSTTCPTHHTDRTWTVGPGDTLWLIAGCHPDIAPTRDLDVLRAEAGLEDDEGDVDLDGIAIPTDRSPAARRRWIKARLRPGDEIASTRSMTEVDKLASRLFGVDDRTIRRDRAHIRRAQ